MNENEKKAICEALRAYVGRYPSQRKAADSLKGTSAGTVSSILNGKWELISDEMWKGIAAQVMRGNAMDWELVETGTYKEVQYALEDAQVYKNVTWVTGEAGCGKSTTARMYQQANREVFLVSCSEDMRKSDFVREIARCAGIRTEGCTIRESWGMLLAELAQMDQPLLVFDEADKLSDAVFAYFISLYNNLEDRCGIVFLSTDYICRRITNGLRYQKQGYKEIFSRIGRKFYALEPTTENDVYAVCTANGLSDHEARDVIREVKSCGCDLRRVKKSVHRIKRMR